jgi:hypothetical protein
MMQRDGCDPFKRLITIAWANINRRTVNGNYPNWNSYGTRRYLEQGIRLEFTRQEFVHWMQRRRHIVNKMWATGERPSIDRKNSRAHYTLNNIRLCTVHENLLAGSSQVRKNAERRMLNKFCLACGKKLIRHPFNGKQSEAINVFNKRKTCGMSCRNVARRAGKLSPIRK